MDTMILGEGITNTTAGSTVETNASPFIEGRKCEAAIYPTPDYNGTGKVQTSADGTTWADALTITGENQAPKVAEITLSRYVRYNPTARTAGGVTFVLRGSK